MALSRPRFLRRDLVLDYGKGVATPEEARRALKRALKANARHAARAGDEPVGLCLVGQARSGEDYRAIRRHYLRKARGWSAARWPESLPSERYALFVAPVTPEAASRRRDNPRPVVEPIFLDFERDLLPPDAALAIAVAVWLQRVAVHQADAAALAPPVLEQYAGGRLLKREVHDYGLEWSLPPVVLDG